MKYRLCPYLLLVFTTAILTSGAAPSVKFRAPELDVPFSAEPQSTSGNDYYVLVWTLISGSNTDSNGKLQVRGVVRTVVYGGNDPIDLTIPKIVIDGTEYIMLSREALNPDPKLFPIALFEYPINSDQRKIEVMFSDGSRFPTPTLVAGVSTVGVLGDTGCRNNSKQSCDAQTDWPFKTIAAHLAAKQPNIVLHVGDFLYTKVIDDCGDYWQAWLSEFFLPAQSLLKTAPLAMVRGNHEGCDCTEKPTMSHGPGWFFLLQAGTAVQSSLSCKILNISPVQPPVWYFDVGNAGIVHRFFLMDSATANDEKAVNVDEFEPLVQQIRDASGTGFTKGTIVTHKPLWGAKGTKKDERINRTLQKAFGKKGPPQKINLIQSGHIHTHEVVRFKNKTGRPLQVVTGNSGIQLNTKVPDRVNDNKIKIQKKKAQVEAVSKFGFDWWSWNPIRPTGWDMTMHILTFSNGGPVWQEKIIEQ